jgi:proton-coupled amino acid transporter
MMSLNLVCSYAIMIYPTNTIIEDYMYRSLSKKRDTKSKRVYYWVQNASRVMVCILAAYCAIELQSKLDKFLSLMGALLCAPLAILYPALIHLGIIAKNKRDVIIDLALVVLALVVLVFSTMQSIESW